LQQTETRPILRLVPSPGASGSNGNTPQQPPARESRNATISPPLLNQQPVADKLSQSDARLKPWGSRLPQLVEGPMLSAAATRQTTRTTVIVLVIDVNRGDRVLIGSPARSDSLALWHHLSILDWLVVPADCARDCARPGAPRGDSARKARLKLTVWASTAPWSRIQNGLIIRRAKKLPNTRGSIECRSAVALARCSGPGSGARLDGKHY
jgi:hypothetical protein